MFDKKKDLLTMQILKTSKITHPICETPLGTLKAEIVKDENEYYLTLDSVRVSKEVSNSLKKLYNV